MLREKGLSGVMEGCEEGNCAVLCCVVFCRKKKGGGGGDVALHIMTHCEKF